MFLHFMGETCWSTYLMDWWSWVFIVAFLFEFLRCPHQNMAFLNIIRAASFLMCWTMFEALASEKLIISYNLYLTDICTKGWKSTYNVGANRRLAFHFRTWAIWPYRLVNVCVLFIIYPVLLLNGAFLWLYLECSLFVSENFYDDIIF